MHGLHYPCHDSRCSHRFHDHPAAVTCAACLPTFLRPTPWQDTSRGVSWLVAGSLLCGDPRSALALVQGDGEPKVQQKRALLVGEGVRFSGSKVSPSSVVLAEELLALA